MIEVLVDTRERGFLTHIGDLGNVRIVQMKVADYVVKVGNKAVAVERKTLGDFISSFRSGRLWEQLVALSKLEEYEGAEVVRRLLVIERRDGDIDFLNERGVASFIGAQMECIYTYHVPIVQVEGKDGMAQFLRVLVSREQKGLNEKMPPARWFTPRIPSDLPMKDQKLLFLTMIPGVGDKLALGLLDRYVSIERLCKASPRDLQRIHGIGNKKANVIFEFLH